MDSRLNVDTSGWQAGLAKLGGDLRVRLARSMAVAGGKVLRDEAKRQAPVESGRLRSQIYLAFKEAKSNAQQVTYSVSWNGNKITGAPHGHLLEFGHWQTHQVVRLPNGDWFSDLSKPLPAPRWIAAKPFLRPAFDVAKQRAQQAMVERGRHRLPELLAEQA
jgi:HK97 gp10 family phage protein